MVIITDLPKVTVFPPSQCVEVTQPVKFTARISGVGMENFNYQWRHDGEDIDGETSSTLIIDSVEDDKVGTYECMVKNEFGEYIISSACELCKIRYLKLMQLLNLLLFMLLM